MGTDSQENSSHAEPILSVVNAFLESIQRGEQPDIESYCAEYPELASELRELLPTVMLMEKVPQASSAADHFEHCDNLPEQIGDYRILGQIGRGGMGVVYEAEQESLGRRVALKVLSANLLSSRNSKERFQQEARAAAQLHHTNIVPVFEVGEEGNIVFYAMQLILGQSLDHVIDELKETGNDKNQGQLQQPGSSVGAALSTAHGSSIIRDKLDESGSSHRKKFCRSVAKIGVQVADALTFAHERGVIHRDIKPSNLLLDGEGVVWVSDFGLAKLDDEGLTQTGELLGTLRYMSPERFEGKCDVRADIYSLGLTLYELLLQRAVFESGDRLKLIQLIHQTEPIRPRQIDPRIPRDLETILLKSIEKQPRQRYQSARLLEQDLQRFLNDEPIRAKRQSPIERSIRWARRNKVLATSACALLTMALVTIAVLSHSLQTTNSALSEAREFAARSLLTQADTAFEQSRFQSAAMLAATSNEVFKSDAAVARLRSARASGPIELMWASSTFLTASAIAQSHDGRFLAAASVVEDSIRVWDTRTFTSIGILSGHQEAVTALCFAPGSRQILSGSKDQTVRLWDIATGKTIWSRSVPSAPGSIAVDARGKYVAVGGVFQGKVWILDCDLGELQYQLAGGSGPVAAMAFAPDGGEIAIGRETGDIDMWDFANDESQTLASPHSCVGVAYVSPTKFFAATGQGMCVWALDEHRQWQSMPIENSTIGESTSLAVNSDLSEIALGSDRSIRFWSTATLEEKSADRLEFDASIGFVGYGENNRRLFVSTANHDVITTANPDPDCSDRTLRYIDRMTGQPVAWSQGHTAPVVQLGFDDENSRLISLGRDNIVRVWDAETGSLQQRLGAVDRRIDSMAIAPDSALIASGSSDGTLRLVEIESGDEIVEPLEVGSPVLGVAFAPSGKWLACLTDRELQFWKWNVSQKPRWEQWQPTLHADKNERFQLRTLAFLPDGSQVACGTSRGRVLFWSVETGELVASIPTDGRRAILGVQFDADGDRLAVLCHEYEVKVFDISQLDTPREINRFQQRAIESMCLSPSGDQLVTGAEQNEAILWDVETGFQISHIEGHRGNVRAVRFGPKGRMLVTSSNAELRMWRIADQPSQHITVAELADSKEMWADHYDMLFRIELSADEKFMLIKGLWQGQYHAVLLNTEDGKKRDFVLGYGGSFDPSRSRLALSFQSGPLEIIDIETDERVELEHDGTPMKEVRFNADGSLLAGVANNRVTIWDTNSRRQVRDFPVKWVKKWNGIEFHPTDSEVLAVSNAVGTVALWNIAADPPRLLRRLDGHPGAIGRVAFSKDGKQLASGGYGEEPTVLLWEVESGKLLQRFIGHEFDVTQVDISPDGRWVASSGRDCTVRLWDIRDGSEVRCFRDHTDFVYSVQFSADGRLLSASSDGTLRVRELKPVDFAGSQSIEQLELSTGLQMRDDRLIPLLRRVDWHFEPTAPGEDEQPR